MEIGVQTLFESESSRNGAIHVSELRVDENKVLTLLGGGHLDQGRKKRGWKGRGCQRRRRIKPMLDRDGVGIQRHN